MKIRIEKGLARGSVTVPPSKSVAHRLLICSALASGESVISNVPTCEDVEATVDALRALGARIERSGRTYRVLGINARDRRIGADIYCRESGSTLRFIIPILMLSSIEDRLTGAEGLMRRPLDVYEELFSDSVTKDGGAVRVGGELVGGEYRVPGDVSSQFISGLLFALPLARGDSTLIISEPIESRPYIELTLGALNAFGIEAIWESSNTLKIKGNQEYRSTVTTVEGDFSAAAFIEALNLFSGEVCALGLSDDSRQGDKVYREYFRSLCEGYAELDVSDCPDNAPILFAIAAAMHGATFTGTRRLKIKESDRAASMKCELERLGARVEIYENSVVVGKCELHAPSSTVNSHNDHRIAMAMAVLLTRFGGEIEGAEAVAKSYPEFWEHLKELNITAK